MPAETAPILDGLVDAPSTTIKFIKPHKSTAWRRQMNKPQSGPPGCARRIGARCDGEDIHQILNGKRHEFENLRDWFRCLYEFFLVRSRGPWDLHRALAWMDERPSRSRLQRIYPPERSAAVLGKLEIQFPSPGVMGPGCSSEPRCGCKDTLRSCRSENIRPQLLICDCPLHDFILWRRSWMGG